MADLSLEWNGDFEVSATGGLVLADGDDLARQRIVRRLLTAVQGYIWHPEYGAGLPQRIGRTAKALMLQSIVRSQIHMEASVAPMPAPRVVVTDVPDGNPGLFVVAITYTEAATKVQKTLSFTV